MEEGEFNTCVEAMSFKDSVTRLQNYLFILGHLQQNVDQSRFQFCPTFNKPSHNRLNGEILRNPVTLFQEDRIVDVRRSVTSLGELLTLWQKFKHKYANFMV